MRSTIANMDNALDHTENSAELPVHPEEEQAYRALIENIQGVLEMKEAFDGYTMSVRDLLAAVHEEVSEIPETALFRALRDSLGIDLLDPGLHDNALEKAGLEDCTYYTFGTNDPKVFLQKAVYKEPPEKPGETEVDYSIIIRMLPADLA